MSESEVQQLIQMAGPPNCILERNNSGAFKDETGRWVFYGLGNLSKRRSDKMKSSDLIGITQIVVTPEMVGQTIGVFTAVEVKRPDWNPDKKLDEREQAQANYISYVLKRGGFAGFANSVDSFLKIIGR